MLGYFSLIERWRYRFLLAVLLAAILLQPLLHGLASGQAVQILAYGAILAGGAYLTLYIAILIARIVGSLSDRKE